ncbi:unnamed protein product [Ixodes hexagonus]
MPYIVCRLQDTGPLFITQVVRTNGSQVARNLSKVVLPTGFPMFDAYSGYITVNEDYESNLFFFLVKAKMKTPHDKLPLTLWMEGGPGYSALLGLFTKNGPARINKDAEICARVTTLQKHSHIIYLDSPIGAGFSFTENLAHGFSRTLTDTSKDIEEFLGQFLQVFPEYCYSDLYVGGESYGGRLAVGFAHFFSKSESNEIPLSLKGVIAGSPFLGPLLDTINPSDFLFSVGMINENARTQMHERFRKIRDESNRKTQLGLLSKTCFQDYTKKNPSLFQQLTGYNLYSSVAYSRIPKEFTRYKDYVNSEDFKTRIHVGSGVTLRAQMPLVFYHLGMDDFFTDIATTLESVMNNCRVLIYGGQLDVIFPATNMERFYDTLTWNGSHEFKHSGKIPWYNDTDPDCLNGYVTKGGNVKYVLLQGAGHDPGFDVPEAIHEMTVKFIQGE